MHSQKYEICCQNFDSLIAKQSNTTNRNEATTRLQLIDTILFDCLGWDKEDVTAEDAYGGEYTDYKLKYYSGADAAIIEAKKESNGFDVAVGTESTSYTLKTLCKDNPKFKEAIQQVAKYCQERGIEIGIVSNGHQFVGFIANRTDGIPPIEGKALIFKSLEHIKENFLEFWNSFSKDGVNKNNLQNKLMGSTITKLPIKLASRILKYPGIQNRNLFQTDMKIISDIVLEDAVREDILEKQFLEFCYCKSGAISQYSLLSSQMLKARYDSILLGDNSPKDLTVIEAVDKKGISQGMKEVFSTKSLSRRPILLVGDVGAGKTSFIRNLIKVEAEEIVKKSLCLLVDLGASTIITNNIRTAIIEEIEKKISTEYSKNIEDNEFVRGVYYKELQHLWNKSIHSDYFKKREQHEAKCLDLEINLLSGKIDNKPSHLKNSVLHLSKGENWQVIIFIDNCDQRNNYDQQEAFLVAQEIAESWNATVFIAIRPETFHQSLKSGALSGYHPKAFTISPPRIDEVIEKRLNFAKKITSGDIQLESLKGINTFTSLDALIGIFIASLNVNKEILELLENISMGNTRKAIDLVKNFFGSAHVDTKKILDIYREDGAYKIPMHEFLRAVMYGENIYFSPKESPVPNIFDVYVAKENEHFLLPILLKMLLDNKGFVEIKEIIGHLQTLGYSVKQVNSAIAAAVDKKLLEASEKGSEFNSEKKHNQLKISSLGAYVVQKLVNYFTYIDTIIIDVPIFAKNFELKIKEVNEIDKRIERVEAFCEYLTSVWKKITQKEKPIEAFFDWENHCEAIRKDMDGIKVKLAARYNKKPK